MEAIEKITIASKFLLDLLNTSESVIIKFGVFCFVSKEVSV